MYVEELVESILASVQWDRWRFHVPTAKPLLRQDVVVVSHDDLDHWHPNFRQKDLVLIPWRMNVPARYNDLTNLMRAYGSISVGKMKFTQVDKRALERFLQHPIGQAPHAFWWLVEKREARSDVRVLFIGDVNVSDAPVASELVRMMFRLNLTLHGLILPSYGGMYTHGSRYAMECSELVRELACEARNNYGAVLGALPHPVEAEWADLNAVKI